MKNKKVLIIALVVVVVLAVVLAVVLLGGEKEYKLGMGAVAGDHTNAQANLTIATVVLDADGKIVACRLDVAQNKYAVNEAKNGLVFYSGNDQKNGLQTKKELGNKYGMAGKVANVEGSQKLEWYKQAEAFEAWVVGKTVAEVEALKTKLAGGHNIADDDALLNAGCTVDVVDFKNAVVAACKDDQSVTFKAGKDFALGLGVNSADDKSVYTDDKNYTVKLNVEFAASVVVDGKVVASLNDAYQPNVVVVNGEVTLATVGSYVKAAKNGVFKTKRELKDDYAMRETSSKTEYAIGKEWFEQSAAYSAYVVGKTADEIKGLELNDELRAGCTIYIGGINAVVAESITNAR